MTTTETATKPVQSDTDTVTLPENEDSTKPAPYLWLAHHEELDDPIWFLPLESEQDSSVWDDPKLEIQIVWWDEPEAESADEPDEQCKIVGCERAAVTTVLYSPSHLLPSEWTSEMIRQRAQRDDEGYAVEADTCLQCRRALEYGDVISGHTLFDEWCSEQEQYEFESQSCVRHRTLDSATTQTE